MTEYDVAFIGTGANPDQPSVDGAAMAYDHAEAYDQLENCRLVGCADIVPENARAFAEEFDIPTRAVFDEYTEMIRTVEPDVVSICTPPSTHADLVIGAANTGVVDAIHCEKPMALTWGGSRRMAEVCQRRGVQLTFNHMRRFGDPFRAAKRRLDRGVIGDLQRVEYSWGNFFDKGTHAIDLCNYFNDERPARWVIGQLDYQTEDIRFGTHNENQVLASWEYDNGVYGMASTGPGAGLVGSDWRLTGTDGFIDVHVSDDVGVSVYTTDDGSGERLEFDSLTTEASCIDLAIADVVGSLEEGQPSELCAENALNATEIIFAGYESARRRSRVDLPLKIDDNPLEAMVKAGELEPASVRAADD